MKSECTYTRKQLPRYLQGHLFKLQMMRVERHLAQCAVCRSQFDALQRIRETKHILRDIEHGGGVAGKARSLGSAAMRLFYRPLWAVLIVLSVTLLYRMVITPILHDPDLEQLDAGTAPPESPASGAVLQTTPTPTPAPPVAAKAEPVSEAPPKVEPLVVTITVDKEREAENMKRINEAMTEHAALRTLRFSDKVREVTGSLTADELYVFFNRLQDAGKISYRRSRLKAAANGEMVPFVFRFKAKASPIHQDPVKPVSPAVEQPAAKPAEQPAKKIVDAPGENSAGTTAQGPAEQPAAPSQPAQ